MAQGSSNEGDIDGLEKMVSRYLARCFTIIRFSQRMAQGSSMKGVCFRSGYDRLSRDCSQSERDGCAQIQTMISMPLPVYNPIVGKGRQ